MRARSEAELETSALVDVLMREADEDPEREIERMIERVVRARRRDDHGDFQEARAPMPEVVARDEFVCMRCHLVQPRARLSDAAIVVCRDCDPG